MRIPIFILSGLLAAGVTAGEKLMLEQDSTCPIERRDALATFVIHVDHYTFKAMPKLTCDWFIDGTWIGRTKGTTYFSTSVDPGEHWVYAMQDESSNRTRAFRLRFEAGKSYFILAKEVPRALILIGQSEEQFNEYRTLYAPVCLIRNPGANGVPQLRESTMAAARKEFEKDLRDDPARMDDLINCKGY